MIRMGTGDLIKSSRKGAGLKQAVLADRLGISLSSYSRLETGQRQARADELFKIAAILGVSVDELQPIEIRKYDWFSSYPLR